MKSNNHDSHYDKLVIEPTDVSEQIMNVNAHSVPRTVAFHMAKAGEYIMRCGLKEGQHWEKELEKARNHIHRALTGKWLAGTENKENKLISTAQEGW